jgi:hypothetical protein
MSSTTMSGTRAMVAAVLIGWVSGCALQPSAATASATEAPADFPEPYYRQAAALGARVFLIDPASSLVVIEVRRGGSLARLGHDHVVASRDVQGFVAPGAGRADLYVRLDHLVVDEPGLRAEAGFDTQPTGDDIAGTRRNMLNALEAARFPFARIGVTRADEGGSESGLRVAVTLHGIARTYRVPVQVEGGADAIAFAGRLRLKQTDFGITPLSVLGGAIQVQDEVDLRFQIRARALN